MRGKLLWNAGKGVLKLNTGIMNNGNFTIKAGTWCQKLEHLTKSTYCEFNGVVLKNLHFNTQLSRNRVSEHCTQNASVYQTRWSVVIYNSTTARMGEIKCLFCCCVWISLTKCFFTVIRQIVFYSSAFICHCLQKELSLHPVSIHKSRHLLEQTGKIQGFFSSTQTGRSRVQLDDNFS